MRRVESARKGWGVGGVQMKKKTLAFIAVATLKKWDGKENLQVRLGDLASSKDITSVPLKVRFS